MTNLAGTNLYAPVPISTRMIAFVNLHAGLHLQRLQPLPIFLHSEFLSAFNYYLLLQNYVMNLDLAKEFFRILSACIARLVP